MLEALRPAGFWAIAKPRYPRTSIICRTAAAVREATLLKTVSDNLEATGSAMVLRIGGDTLWIWPDKPWPNAMEKSWRGVKN